MEYLSLLFLHVLFGIIWAGGVLVVGLFLIPSIADAGQAGGLVMQGVMKRRLPLLMSIASLLVILTGTRLFMLRWTPGWLTSPEGLVLSLGALLGVAAFFLGMFVQKPIAQRLGALAARVAASGAPPSAEQSREMDAMRGRLVKIARVTAWHVLAAAVLMAMHRLVPSA